MLSFSTTCQNLILDLSCEERGVGSARSQWEEEEWEWVVGEGKSTSLFEQVAASPKTDIITQQFMLI